MKKKTPDSNAAEPQDPAAVTHHRSTDTPHSTTPRPRFCVWTQGRLNLRKLCDQNGRCADCSLDKALHESAEKNREARRRGIIPLSPHGRVAFTRERLQLLPKGERPCLLYANGFIDYKICCKNYECVFCEFDRYFSEQHQVHAVVRPLDVLNIQGFRMPQGYYYHRAHTWVRVAEKSEVSLGLDDFALRLLGPLDYIAAPRIGNRVIQGQPALEIGRGPHRATLLSPVGGIVAAINFAVQDHPSLAAEDPYAGGWIFKVQADNLRQELKHLLIGSEYAKHLDQEIERLLREIEMIGGEAALEAATSSPDLADHVPDIGWERLMRLFLSA